MQRATMGAATGVPMKPEASSVASYLDAVAAQWRPALDRLRAECLTRLAGYDERIAYGMPAYARDGTVEIAFAKQARYLSLYVAKTGVLDAHRSELGGLSLGRGCVRYARPGQIDWAVVGALLDATVRSDEPPC